MTDFVPLCVQKNFIIYIECFVLGLTKSTFSSMCDSNEDISVASRSNVQISLMGLWLPMAPHDLAVAQLDGPHSPFGSGLFHMSLILQRRLREFPFHWLKQPTCPDENNLSRNIHRVHVEAMTKLERDRICGNDWNITVFNGVQF